MKATPDADYKRGSVLMTQMELDVGVDQASILKMEASLAKFMATRKQDLREDSLWVVLSASAVPFKSVLNVECILNFKCTRRAAPYRSAYGVTSIQRYSRSRTASNCASSIMPAHSAQPRPWQTLFSSVSDIRSYVIWSRPALT